MKIVIHYQDYIGYRVKVKDKDGDIIEGTLITYEHGYDEEPEVDYDTLGIQPIGVKGYYIGIPVTDIEEFEVLE